MGINNLTNKMIQSTKNFHMLVLQHLDGDELIRLTEVDSELSKEISNCPHCMCKIAVHLTIEKYNKFKELESIVKSNRQYRNFKLTCGNQEEFSELFLPILSIFFQSIVRIDANGVMLPTNQYELSLPNLKFLKISFSNLNALSVFLNATDKYQKLHIENFNDAISDRQYIDQIMRFRNVRLVNMEYIDMIAIKNLDFLYSNCVDFQFECNRKSDYKSLAKLFEIIQCKEIQIRWMKRGCEGYRLTLHRLKRIEEISIPIVDLFERRKRRKISNCDTSCLPPEYFLVLLEISELSWSFMKKIGNVLTDLQALSIFDLSEREKRNFFLTFKNLETITTIGEINNQMETETTTDRKSMELKYSSKDPLFKLSSENLELVFRHFTADDFQNAAEVSGSWNNIISKSSRFMSLLKLRLVKIKRGNAEDLTYSLKHFENIEISCNYDAKVVPDVICVLNFYSNFIVDLYLHEIKAKRVEPFFMPNLKFLTLHSVSDNFCGSFLDSCLTLKSVKFQNMLLSEKFFYRIQNMRQLERLHFVDIECEHVKSPQPRVELKLKNIKHVELSFSMVKLIKESGNSSMIERFLQDPCFQSIESITLSGLRGNVINRILRLFKQLSKIELMNFWKTDYRDLDRFELKVDLYVQNAYYLENLNWQLAFQNHGVIHVGTPIIENRRHIEESHRNFLRMLGTSGKRMIKNNTFAIESPMTSSIDPLLQISSDLHDLIFQHFSYNEALNSLEVSRSWNVLCKVSRIVMDKFKLKLPVADNYINRDIINTFSRNHQNVFLHTHSFSFITRFSQNLRSLTIICNGNEVQPEKNQGFGSKPEKKEKSWNFPNLEHLTIRKYNMRSGQIDNVKNLLSYFKRCTRLKSMVIYESLDSSTANDFFTILRNNKDLKELRIVMIKAIVKYFEFDWADGIECQLQKLTLGFHETELHKGNNVDQKLLSFLKLHRNTCEELVLSYCSTPMFNEVFANFPKIHTFYATNGFNMDGANLSVNITIENCILPFGLATAHMPYLIERLPNVEKLFLSKIDNEVVQSMAINLERLKNLSYYTEHENCIRRYRQLTANTGLRRVMFIKLENIKFEGITMASIFQEKGPFKWVEPPRRFRSYGRYERDEDDDDDEEFAEMERFRT
ncbi:hypothetical protein ACKWTF_016086 [Chironomus riparius]